MILITHSGCVNETGIAIDDLMIFKCAGRSIITSNKNNNMYSIKGAYVHPALIIYIACWCNYDFALIVKAWIKRWIKYAEENNLVQYQKAITILSVPWSRLNEYSIKIKLCNDMIGTPEVSTPYGMIDIVTKNKIITVEKIKYFKHALGQMLANAIEYPDKYKCIYLYDLSLVSRVVHIQKLLLAPVRVQAAGAIVLLGARLVGAL